MTRPKRRFGLGAFFAWFAILPKSRLGWQQLFRRFSLWRHMIAAALKGEADFPWGTVAAFGLAILYTVFPLDVIPDIFLVFGWLDDAFIVLQCMKLIKRDLRKYAARQRIEIEPFGL